MEETSVLDSGSCAGIDERQRSIITSGRNKSSIHCSDDSLAGSVSQRACVFCGARVVLNPVTDVIHLVHGPIGCATYTMDIRGSLSSGSELYRNSFSTDLKETDVVFGGEKKRNSPPVSMRSSPNIILRQCSSTRPVWSG